MYDPKAFETIRQGIKKDLPEKDKVLAEAVVSVLEQLVRSVDQVARCTEEALERMPRV